MLMKYRFFSKRGNIIHLPGTRHRKYLEENTGATDVKLSTSEIEEIESLHMQFPDIGSRYSETYARQEDKS